jgi:putative phosphoribosyl transferase
MLKIENQEKSREMSAIFRNRTEGGKMLAALLKDYVQQNHNILVLTLPRGGVPVGYEIAKALKAPLDVFLVRKLGVPGHEELAMGAIAQGGVRVLNERVLQSMNIPENVLEDVTNREQQELERRAHLYRGNRPPLEIEGRTIILVDDGLATGASMRAAVQALQQLHPAKIIVAVPVAALATYKEFCQLVDEVVCAHTPDLFYGVGLWYQDFSQVPDEVVHNILQSAEQELSNTTYT